MARLNELPGPAESIEALKRRFVRQNREIARVNSLQSLRIQGLEAELSHLLKENAALKEQVISLTQDAEKYAAGRAFHKEIHQCKDKLAAKVSELNKLVSELGLIPETFLKKTAHLETEGETQRSSDPSRRPITWNDNGDRLPTIMEDKYYPRRTLNPQEFAESQDIDSPSIGSPPVAHFDMNQSPLSRRRDNDFLDTGEAILPDVEDDNHSPARSASNMNVELPSTEQPVSPSKSASRPVLSGSKRKFSVTEDEITFSPLPVTNTSTIDDDFQFTRAVDLRTDRPNVAVEIVNEPVGKAKKQTPKKGPTAKRRVLEPKTTNMASLTKKQTKEAAQQVEGKPEKPMNKQGGDENSRRAEPAKKISQFQSDNAKRPKRAATAIIHEDEPIKPLVSSIPEPQESGRIQKKAFNADEPAVTDSMPLPGLGSRPSRRARGAISYAEPNLRDKMRRATNELVDAVILAGDRRASSTVGTPGREHDHESSTLNNIPEEHELSIDSNAATTTATQALTELSKHMVTERKRRTLSVSTNDIIRLNDLESGSILKQTSQINDSSAMLSPSADKSVALNITTQSQSRRRSANPTAQSRRHSSNPAVSDRGNSSLDDEISGYDSEFHDDSLEDSQSGIKDISTTKTKTSRTLTEESSTLLAKRGQRASTRRRSMMV